MAWNSVTRCLKPCLAFEDTLGDCALAVVVRMVVRVVVRVVPRAIAMTPLYVRMYVFIWCFKLLLCGE